MNLVLNKISTSLNILLRPSFGGKQNVCDLFKFSTERRRIGEVKYKQALEKQTESQFNKDSLSNTRGELFLFIIFQLIRCICKN